MRSIGLLLLVSAVAFGQQHFGAAGVSVFPGSHNTFGSPTGFGNVVFPGTGHAPMIRSITPGLRFNQTPGGRFNRGGSTGAVVYVPYAVGGYQYYGPQGDTGVEMGNPNQQQGAGAAPTVVINQNFVPATANPVVREYVPDGNGGVQPYPPQSPTGAQQEGNSSPESPAFLIAFKDHTIYAAVGYWVEGDTLHYITSGNTHNQVSLDLVDRELSARLNGERGVGFLLPPAHK
jgi:hypothetical protein